VEICARQLGHGLSLLIDILNPEVIVIGSIFARQEKLLRPIMEKLVREEALPLAAKICRIVPAALGDEIGDYASLSVAACGGDQT
jgi:glucokinase